MKGNLLCKWRSSHFFITVALILAVLLLLILPGCARLGPIEPVSSDVHEEIDARCRAHFLDRPWQLVQAVTVYLPNGEVRNAIGVTNVFPEQKRINCVIMSLEGIVLFDGVYDQQIKIRKAVPPFDAQRFAATLFDDIRLVFFSPNSSADAQAAETGMISSGVPVCRYEQNGGGFVEILFKRDGLREIRRYSGRKKHVITVDACYDRHCSRQGVKITGEIPATLTIYHHGLVDYRLELTLIEAKILAPEKAK